MRKHDKIVRVREIKRTNEDKSRWVYKDYLTTWEDLMSKTAHKGYGGSINERPYKFLEIQRFWMIPSFIFHRWLLSKRLTRKQNISVAIPITIFSIESLSVIGISKGIMEITKYIFH